MQINWWWQQLPRKTSQQYTLSRGGAGRSEEENLGSMAAGMEAAVMAVKNYRPALVSYSNSYQQCRRWEVVMAQLRLAVCVFTHQHLFSGTPIIICEKCSEIMTIHHLLIECPEYEIQRKTHKKIEGITTFDLKNLLGEDASVTEILKFLDKVGYIKRV